MEVVLPNGVVLEGIPEGITKEQVKAKAISAGLATEADFGVSSKPDQSEAEAARLTRQAQPKREPTVIENLFGSGNPLVRAAYGSVVEPAMGYIQTAAKTFGAFLPEQTQKDIVQGVTDISKGVEQAQQQARGTTDFDWVKLAGTVVSPMNLVTGPSSAVTKVGKIGEAVKLGAASAATQTVDNPEAFAEEKLKQVLIGAAVGGTVMTGAQVLKTVKGVIDDLPLTAAARERIQKKYVQELVGKNKDEVIAKLRGAQEIVPGSKPTVAEALSETPAGARLVAEQSRVAKTTPEPFLERTLEQQKARESLLTGTFGTEDTITRWKDARTRITSTMRDSAMKWADVYGETAPSLIKAVEGIEAATKKAKTFFPSGEKQATLDVLGQNLEFKKAQLKSLSDNGFFPLEATSVLQKIDDLSKTPGSRTNDLLLHAANKIKSKLTDPDIVDEFGIIKSDDLYNIRKQIGEDLTEYLTAKGNASFSNEASKVEKTLQSLIDGQMNKASGSTLWTDYLKTFSRYSTKIDRMKTGQALQSKLRVELSDKENAGAFAKAVEEFTPVAKKATGGSFYDKPEDLFTPNELRAVNAVYADLSRRAVAEKIGRAANKGSGLPNEAEKEIPTVFNQYVTAFKSLIATLRRGSQKEFDAKMTELSLDPRAMAEFISSVPATKAQQLVSAMMSKASPEVQDILRKALVVAPSASVLQGVDQGTQTKPLPKPMNTEAATKNTFNPDSLPPVQEAGWDRSGAPVSGWQKLYPNESDIYGQARGL